MQEVRVLCLRAIHYLTLRIRKTHIILEYIRLKQEESKAVKAMFEYVQEREISRRLEQRTMVYIITHGEVEKGRPGKLSERGRNQVMELAHSRIVVGVQKLYSSPKREALETSELLRKEFDCALEKMDCLTDLQMGFNWDDDEKLKASIALLWKDEDFKTEKGESLADARERIGECMNGIAAKHPGNSVAVVTHSIIATLFFSLVTAAPLDINEWLMTGHASCATYEYANTGWTLLMPSDNSFQSSPSSVADWLPDEIFD
jgi:broad specificity phosphatase PhoE